MYIKDNVLYDLKKMYIDLQKNKKISSFKSICLSIKVIEMYNRPLFIRVGEYFFFILNIVFCFGNIRNITIGKYQQRVSYILDKCNIKYELHNENKYIKNIQIDDFSKIKCFICSIGYPYAIKKYYRYRFLSRKHIFTSKDLKKLAYYYNGEENEFSDKLNYYTALNSLYSNSID